ncbi:MAG: hypothetical protein J0L63_20120 [Anaerolineae bacterium]|nr:hypothetical protein [Anaerolineae bacterium]MBN8621230.1 hypothetical protein [Anaerolineae bacterium]
MMMQPNSVLLLANRLKFSADDLFANRAGILSPAQALSLRQARLKRVARWGTGIIAFAMGATALNARPMMLMFGAACLMSFIVAGWFQIGDDLNGRVLSVVDQVRVEPRVRMLPVLGYQLQAGREVFGAHNGLLGAFDGRRRYRLYYTSGTRTLLAAEEVGSAV